MEIPSFEEIYKMKDHELFRFDSGSLHVQIMRVPHGWIYTQMDKASNIGTSTFVPFETELNVNAKVQY